MAGLDGTEVRVAGSGHVWAAPSATALPTDMTALAAAYVDLGYVTTDGVTFSFNRETEDLDAWQGSKLRVLTTAEPASVTLALMQSNKDTLPVAFGGGTVTEPSAGVFKYEPPASGVNTERVLIIEFIDGTVDYRYVLPRVQVEGEVTFTLQKASAVTYPITFGILDATPKWYLLSDDANLDPGP